MSFTIITLTLLQMIKSWDLSSLVLQGVTESLTVHPVMQRTTSTQVLRNAGASLTDASFIALAYATGVSSNLTQQIHSTVCSSQSLLVHSCLVSHSSSAISNALNVNYLLFQVSKSHPEAYETISKDLCPAVNS